MDRWNGFGFDVDVLAALCASCDGSVKNGESREMRSAREPYTNERDMLRMSIIVHARCGLAAREFERDSPTSLPVERSSA